MIAEERPLAGFEPPPGTFSVSCINHKGQGVTIAWRLEEAASMFSHLADTRADYPLLVSITAKQLKKYLRRRRERDAKVLTMAALSTALASPYCDFAAQFSAAVREHNRAAVSVVFGKRRGLIVTIGQCGFDDAGVLKRMTRMGLGPMTIANAGKPEVLQ